jgi:hypothetical protein
MQISEGGGVAGWLVADRLRQFESSFYLSLLFVAAPVRSGNGKDAKARTSALAARATILRRSKNARLENSALELLVG